MFDLDEADGQIGLVNFCDTHRDAVVIIKMAARNQAGAARCNATLIPLTGPRPLEALLAYALKLA